MATLFGHLGFGDTDRVFGDASYQQQFFEETRRVFDRYNADVQASMTNFVDPTPVTVATRRYRLPGGGIMQSRGGLAQSKAVKGKGYWDVAFPLNEIGDQLAADTVAIRYMSVGEYDVHVVTIIKRHAARLRFDILKRMFNNTSETFADPLYGSLTVQPLANGDATTYPPAFGASAEATADHYIGSNFTAANISDTNNPYVLIVAKLEPQFGYMQGGANIVTFIHPDQTAKTQALTDFVDVADNYTMLGDNERTLMGLPSVPGSARLIGRTNGTWVAEWLAGIPTGYMLGTHLEAPKPLIKRVDEAVGIPQGLHIAAQSDGSDYPFEQAHYMDRYGIGASNRLNGVALQLVASTTYGIPTVYA